MSRRSEQLEAAICHLRRCDPVMKKTIRQVGPFTLKLRRDRFATLARSIVGQQVSGKAAAAIWKRVEALVAPAGVSPISLSQPTSDELRSVGLSRQKASYLLDLCEKTNNGCIQLNRLGRLSDEEIIAELTQVKGIGRWTVEMLLMFSLGRLDVLPCDDLGIRSGIKHLYDLDDLPKRAECIAIAEPWRPYASVASWYCWRSLEL